MPTTTKILIAFVALLMFLVIAKDAKAETKVPTQAQVAKCQALVKQMPKHTKFAAVTHNGNRCAIEFDTINGYEPFEYVKKFGCTYDEYNSYKYLITEVPGYEFSREGYKYIRSYSCPVR